MKIVGITELRPFSKNEFRKIDYEAHLENSAKEKADDLLKNRRRISVLQGRLLSRSFKKRQRASRSAASRQRTEQ